MGQTNQYKKINTEKKRDSGFEVETKEERNKGRKGGEEDRHGRGGQQSEFFVIRGVNRMAMKSKRRQKRSVMNDRSDGGNTKEKGKVKNGQLKESSGGNIATIEALET